MRLPPGLDRAVTYYLAPTNPPLDPAHAHMVMQHNQGVELTKANRIQTDAEMAAASAGIPGRKQNIDLLQASSSVASSPEKNSQLLGKRRRHEVLGGTVDVNDLLDEGHQISITPSKYRSKRAPRKAQYLIRPNPLGDVQLIGAATDPSVAIKQEILEASDIAAKPLAMGAAKLLNIKQAGDVGGRHPCLPAKWAQKYLAQKADEKVQQHVPNGDPLEVAKARKEAIAQAQRDLALANQGQAEGIRDQLADMTCPGLVTNAGDPTPLMGWGLMAAYYGEHQADPPLKDTPAVSAHTYFLGKAAELYKVQCRVCFGYGHTKEYCPTLARLKAATARDKHVNAWLTKAITRPYKGMRRAVGNPEALGELAVLHYKVPEGYLDASGAVKKNALRP